MILIIDNFDSFTYNLVQTIGLIGRQWEIRVFRNNQIDVDRIAELDPSHLVLSPGPCTPNEAGISVACVSRFSGKIPLLGVCLGHQSIGQATGGRIVRAKQLMHGKIDHIEHNEKGLFAGIRNPMKATRYHSLVIEPDSLSADFDITAWTRAPDGSTEIMAIQHKSHPTYGVQFHPESFLTEQGPLLIANFLTGTHRR